MRRITDIPLDLQDALGRQTLAQTRQLSRNSIDDTPFWRMTWSIKDPVATQVSDLIMVRIQRNTKLNSRLAV
jgi:hypothetical protein